MASGKAQQPTFRRFLIESCHLTQKATVKQRLISMQHHLEADVPPVFGQCLLIRREKSSANQSDFDSCQDCAVLMKFRNIHAIWRPLAHAADADHACPPRRHNHPDGTEPRPCHPWRFLSAPRTLLSPSVTRQVGATGWHANCSSPRSNGLTLLTNERNQDWEAGMITSLQIFIGFVIGCTGLLQIASTPFSGCSALVLGGFLILDGIDHLCRNEE